MSDNAIIDAEFTPKSTAIARPADWGGAAARGLEARQEREKIVKSVLKDGPDFGIIPGTTKATLLKPGAEKIADSLNLYPDYEVITATEDFDKPLFFYRYRCVLRSRGNDGAVATGIGSCNSMEARYRWRKAERLCPNCKKPAIIKGKEEYGGGWVCFKKKDGCGAKFPDGYVAVESQEVGKVENDDIASCANTIDKMAQKRALMSAVLNLGFSEQFTCDLDDSAGHDEPEHPEPPKPAEKPKVQPAAQQARPQAQVAHEAFVKQWQDYVSAEGAKSIPATEDALKLALTKQLTPPEKESIRLIAEECIAKIKASIAKKPDNGLEIDDTPPLVAEWKLKLDPNIVNLAKLNGEITATFKAIPGNTPGRAKVWQMMLNMAEEFGCYYNHGSKTFVEKAPTNNQEFA